MVILGVMGVQFAKEPVTWPVLNCKGWLMVQWITMNLLTTNHPGMINDMGQDDSQGGDMLAMAQNGCQRDHHDF